MVDVPPVKRAIAAMGEAHASLLPIRSKHALRLFDPLRHVRQLDRLALEMCLDVEAVYLLSSKHREVPREGNLLPLAAVSVADRQPLPEHDRDATLALAHLGAALLPALIGAESLRGIDAREHLQDDEVDPAVRAPLQAQRLCAGTGPRPRQLPYAAGGDVRLSLLERSVTRVQISVVGFMSDLPLPLGIIAGI
jgi:hypothetical protein